MSKRKTSLVKGRCMFCGCEIMFTPRPSHRKDKDGVHLSSCTDCFKGPDDYVDQSRRQHDSARAESYNHRCGRRHTDG